MITETRSYPLSSSLSSIAMVILLLMAQQSVAQESVKLTIHFENGSDEPPVSEMALLQEIVEHPNAGQLRFHIVGHTDDTGSLDSNIRLSEKRALKVAFHLLSAGIEPSDIRFEHKGEECPLAIGKDPLSRAQNRRVEVFISNKGARQQTVDVALYREGMFQRPLPGEHGEKEAFTIDNTISSCVHTASGTRIDVPAMAFMDAYGRPISGAVQLTYEEISDPLAIFLSGIAMRTSGEAHPPIETAGMFNLSAAHDGRTVEIRPDRPVHIEMASNSLDRNYGLLYLDPVTEQWKEEGQAAINPYDAALISMGGERSSAVSEYLNRTDYLSPSKARRTTLKERFLNMEYLVNRPIASYYRFLRKGDEKEQKQFDKKWKKVASFEGKVFPPNKNNSEKAIHFVVRKHTAFGQHPEYFFFNFHTWEYDGDLSRSQIGQMLHGKRFTDIRVRYDAEKDSVSLALKDLDGLIELPVKKVTIENMSVELQKRMFGEFSPAFKAWKERQDNRGFEDRYAIYSDLLQRQENRLSVKADKADKRAQHKYAQELNVAWKQARKSMDPTELMMDQEQWMSHCRTISSKLEELYALQQGTVKVMRDMAITRTGIYNCARPIDQSRFRTVIPRFVLSDGEVVNWKTCYVFDEKINSVVRYGAREMESIGLDPGNIKMMIVTDENDRIFQLNESEVVAMNLGRSTQRIMHLTEFDSSVQSLDGMREMLGWLDTGVQ